MMFVYKLWVHNKSEPTNLYINLNKTQIIHKNKFTQIKIASAKIILSFFYYGMTHGLPLRPSIA